MTRPAPEVPAVPDGWVVAPPDFVGVGVQRSGTTWWYDVVVAHPGITPSIATRKELMFLGTVPDPPPAGLEAIYARYFPRPPGTITGEWTASYITREHTVRLLAQAAPGTRVLAILRDPLARLRSGVNRLHQIAPLRGRPAPTPNQLRKELDKSLYAAPVQRLLSLFPRERVLILQHERCVADPQGQAERTWAFLGLEPAEAPRERVEATPNRRRYDHPLEADLEAEAVAAIPPDAAGLAALVPEIDLGLWPSARA